MARKPGFTTRTESFRSVLNTSGGRPFIPRVDEGGEQGKPVTASALLSGAPEQLVRVSSWAEAMLGQSTERSRSFGALVDEVLKTHSELTGSGRSPAIVMPYSHSIEDDRLVNNMDLFLNPLSQNPRIRPELMDAIDDILKKLRKSSSGKEDGSDPDPDKDFADVLDALEKLEAQKRLQRKVIIEAIKNENRRRAKSESTGEDGTRPLPPDMEGGGRRPFPIEHHPTGRNPGWTDPYPPDLDGLGQNRIPRFIYIGGDDPEFTDPSPEGNSEGWGEARRPAKAEPDHGPGDR